MSVGAAVTCRLDWAKGPAPELAHKQTSRLLLAAFLRLIFREEGKHRCVCSTYLCIYWLFLACATTRDRTHKLGVLGQHCNPASYPARATKAV